MLKNNLITTTLNKGFTIVELIVVVVVIAILSSVTVVGYSGITNKADSSQAAALVQEWTTTLNMYKTMSGTYPKGNLDYVCLGKIGEYTAMAPFDNNQCYKSSWTVSSDDAMLNDIKSQTGGLPGGSYVKARKLGDESYRSLLYLSRNGGFGITYILPKSTDTCLADDLFFEQSRYTVCRRVLEGDPYSGL